MIPDGYRLIPKRVGKHRKWVLKRTCVPAIPPTSYSYLWSDGTWWYKPGRRPGYNDGGGYFKNKEQAEEALALSKLVEYNQMLST